MKQREEILRSFRTINAHDSIMHLARVPSSGRGKPPAVRSDKKKKRQASSWIALVRKNLVAQTDKVSGLPTVIFADGRGNHLLFA